MTHQEWFAVTIGDAIRDFSVSKSTIERRISEGEIAQTQIFMKDGKRHIYISELIRVFWEPRKRVKDEAAEETKQVAEGLDSTEVIVMLREQIATTERREREALERAERYEKELTDARKRIDELTNGVFSAMQSRIIDIEKRPNWFSRLFAGKID